MVRSFPHSMISESYLSNAQILVYTNKKRGVCVCVCGCVYVSPSCVARGGTLLHLCPTSVCETKLLFFGEI